MTLLSPLSFLAVLCIGLFFGTYVSITFQLQQLYHRLLTSPPPDGSEFDFVVVGSGSAGSVVTRRLAEAGHSVLLIEAGGPSHWLDGVPAAVPYFMGSSYDWKYSLEPSEKSGLAMEGGRVKKPRGRVLGGSSMLNWMLHVRGHSKDYDEWDDMLGGNKGWTYKDVLPYFKKFQDFVGEVENKDKYHGTGGPLGVMPTAHVQPANDVMQSAFVEKGIPLGDVNGASEDQGFWERIQVFQAGGWRMGSYRSFVEPVLDQLDITVLPFSLATKIMFEDETKKGGDPLKAAGIEVLRFGQTLRYLSRKETILSGGAIGSPQLLMVSGLGPKEHLQQVGVPVRSDLPGVGSNLQDHIMSVLPFYTQESGLTTSPFGLANPLNFYQLFTSGSGPLTDNSLGTNGFIRTRLQPKEDSRPDIQFHTTPWGFTLDYGLGLAPAFSFASEAYNDFMGKYADEYYGVQLWPTLLRPKSRGVLRLRSNSTTDHPILEGFYLKDQNDVDVMVEALKFSHSLKDTEAFKRHGLFSSVPDSKHCGPPLEPWSDEYWACFVRHWTITVYHECCTAAMGREGDGMAVLDHKLRVRGGVKGLRVADASVMPTLVGSNTHAPSTMIGERASDIILEEWGINKEAKKGNKKKEEL